jgi:hypothetical protein
VSKTAKKWGAVGVVILVALGAFFLRSRPKPVHVGGSTPQDVDDRESRWRGFAATDPGVVYHPAPPTPNAPDGASPAAPGGPSAPPVEAQKDEAVMDRWRHGILEKNAEVVLDLDQWFAAEPPRFGPQLEILAGTDPDDRVRAFSTRVLGKYKNVAAVGVFEHLLSDRSPYVRQNGAWALGELAERPGGRPAAARSLGELQRLQESDPVPDVRSAAAAALKKLQ